MGACFSKKKGKLGSSYALNPPENSKFAVQLEKFEPQEQVVVKKEAYFTPQRKSCELEKQRSSVEEKSGAKKLKEEDKNVSSCWEGAIVPPRSSSCTKEELDAILIQCGRLSRSSSTSKGGGGVSEDNVLKKYSGSKRSYDFDAETGNIVAEEAVASERETRRRERIRDSQGRRRTPSCERGKEQTPQKLSRSRDRVSSGVGGRRVSRSPGRRSVSPIAFGGSTLSSSTTSSRPGKLVSVPPTVPAETAAITRIHVRRNAGSETPRNRSPARQQPPSLSRSNSKRATENSPFRRNPLAEIDTNVTIPQAAPKKKQINHTNIIQTNKEATEIIKASETAKPSLGSRSSHLSIDLDRHEEAQETKISSYTALLLEDIQNFHQKTTPLADFALPACVTKACSILEAVADLNSNMGPSMAGDNRRNTKTLTTDDDVIKQRFQNKYVTVERGTTEESCGSNSIAGVGNDTEEQGVSASKWEPSSVESTDRSSASSSKGESRCSEAGKRTWSSQKRDLATSVLATAAST